MGSLPRVRLRGAPRVFCAGPRVFCAGPRVFYAGRPALSVRRPVVLRRADPQEKDFLTYKKEFKVRKKDGGFNRLRAKPKIQFWIGLFS